MPKGTARIYHLICKYNFIISLLRYSNNVTKSFSHQHYCFCDQPKISKCTKRIELNIFNRKHLLITILIFCATNFFWISRYKMWCKKINKQSLIFQLVFLASLTAVNASMIQWHNFFYEYWHVLLICVSTSMWSCWFTFTQT